MNMQMGYILSWLSHWPLSLSPWADMDIQNNIISLGEMMRDNVFGENTFDVVASRLASTTVGQKHRKSVKTRPGERANIEGIKI